MGMGTGTKKHPMTRAEVALSIISSDGSRNASLCDFCKKSGECSTQESVRVHESYGSCGYTYCGNDHEVEEFLRG